MGIFTIVDRSEHPAPKEVYNWRLYLLTFAAILASGEYGYDSGFIGGAITLPAFTRTFGLDHLSGNKLASLKANIVSTFQAGAFFGAAVSLFFNEKLGRKYTLLFFTTLFIVGVVLQIAASGIVGLIYAGRALTGVSVGCISSSVPVYLSEWSPPGCRGRLVGCYEISYQVFLVIGFWVNYGVKLHTSPDTDTQWRIPFGLQLLPAGLFVIFMMFQPESWRWLIRKGKVEEARKSLALIRNLPEDHSYINWEIETCELQVSQSAQNGTSFYARLAMCFKKGTYNRILLAFSVMIFQNLSGINALNYYSPDIFKSIGFSGGNVDLLATGVFGIIKAATNTLTILFGIEKFGRRNCIIWGSIGTIAAMLYITVFSAVSGSFDHTVPRDAGAYVAIVSIYIFAVFYTFSWNAVPFVYCSEIISNEVRDMGMAMAVMMQWLMQFVIVYSNPYMMKNIKWGTFLFFTICLFISIFFTYFLIPETKGLTLENMDIMFNAKGLAIQKRKTADAIIAEMRAQEAITRNDFDDVKEQDETVEVSSNV